MRSVEQQIQLAEPTREYGEAIMEFRKEYWEDNPGGYIDGGGSLGKCQTAEEWIRSVELGRKKETCPPKLADSDIYLAVGKEDHRIIGLADLRHHIMHPVLGQWGGHVGYCVRPSERGKGYASQILHQMKQKAREYGITRLLVTCDEKNIASERVISKNGGVYEKNVWSEEFQAWFKRYWIDLYPYRYETHMHTCEASACARSNGEEMAEAAKRAGYTGIIITDHSWYGNTGIDRSLPWEKWVEEFCKGYEHAFAWGEKNDLQVFFGYESCYDGTEFLIYGVDKKWLIGHPEIKDATIEEQYRLIHEAGGMVIQAHPYRKEDYIPAIRLSRRRWMGWRESMPHTPAI